MHYEACKWESLLPWLDNKESAHVKDQISFPFGRRVTTSVSWLCVNTANNVVCSKNTYIQMMSSVFYKIIYAWRRNCMISNAWLSMTYSCQINLHKVPVLSLRQKRASIVSVHSRTFRSETITLQNLPLSKIHLLHHICRVLVQTCQKSYLRG